MLFLLMIPGCLKQLGQMLLCSYLVGKGPVFLFQQVFPHNALAQTGLWGLPFAERVSSKEDGVILILSFSSFHLILSLDRHCFQH